MKWLYAITGTAADDQTWSVEGEVEVDAIGEFNRVPDQAMREAFDSLTDGKAVFGKPDVGCRGPYAITSLNIARVARIKVDAVVVSGDEP